METRIVLVLFALYAWMAVGLPIYPGHHIQTASIAAAPHNIFQHAGFSSSSTSFPVMKASSASKHGPHFLEWLADTHPEQRDAILRAEAERVSHGRSSNSGNWVERFHKLSKAWSAFYGIQYPSKPRPSSHNHSGRKESSSSPCVVFVDTPTASDYNDVATTTTTTQIAYCSPSSSLPSQSRNATGANFFGQFLHHLEHLDLAMVCSEHGPEIIALCIFLVPISVVLVEVVDMLHDRWVPEQFPERGRARVRLTGPERRLRVLEKCEREKTVRDQAQKLWGGSRRRSRGAFTN